MNVCLRGNLEMFRWYFSFHLASLLCILKFIGQCCLFTSDVRFANESVDLTGSS